MVMQQLFSLVKYDQPEAAATEGTTTEQSSFEASETADLKDLLDSILPPRRFQDGSKEWVQRVSTTPVSRTDIISLQQLLDAKLFQRQARATGICGTRRDLFSQCFDEIIRQCTINCVERGLLLLRVRDELRMTLHAYQTLYASSICFGLRKASQKEQDQSGKIGGVALQLEADNAFLQGEVGDLRRALELLKKRASEQTEALQKRHDEEINFLKRTNQQLKAQLEGILSQKK